MSSTLKKLAYINIILSFALFALGIFPNHFLAIDFNNEAIRSAFNEIDYLLTKEEFYFFNKWYADYPFYLTRILNLLSNFSLVCALIFSVCIALNRLYFPFIFIVFICIVLTPILYFSNIDHWLYTVLWFWWSIINTALFVLSCFIKKNNI